jgi:hypothetical protein
MIEYDFQRHARLMNPLDLVNLTALMERTPGRRDVKIGLIDGPVNLDHADLSTDLIHELSETGTGRCGEQTSAACHHGTFVAGMLCGRRGSPAPAICPGCTLLVCPIFDETAGVEQGNIPSASPEELVRAIRDCIRGGARILNLSLSVQPWSIPGEREVEGALNDAMTRGVIVVAAAGNQGTVGSSVITGHPWVLPVAACDLNGQPAAQSNLGIAIGRRGLSAPGVGVTSLGSSERSVTSSGTSVAAPFVTGAVALLWSEYPAATAAEVRLAITPAWPARRTTVVPRLLNAWAAYENLQTIHTHTRRYAMEQPDEQGRATASAPVSAGLPDPERPAAGPAAAAVAAQAGSPQCGAGCPAGADAGGGGVAAPRLVYALGRIEPRFPSPAIEKEFAQVLGRAGTSGQTDRQAQHSVLVQPGNRYLARQMCWVFTISGVEAYILQPSDPADYQLLVDAIRPAPRPTDIDVVIGSVAGLAPPQACNALMLPLVVFQQIYSFDVDALVKAIPRPEKTSAKEFQPVAEELFARIMLIGDNAGNSDEHRALNYLAVRYDAIYAKAAECFARNNSLASVEARRSHFSGARNLVDVIFGFRHRETDVSEKYSVRVDVSEAFPFLVSKLAPYFDR